MAAAYGSMPIGSALWHQHHSKHANDAGTAAAICELVDNCLAVDDRANASRINLQLSVQVPGSGAQVALLCDNGAGVARVADLAMMFKSKLGLEQAAQHSISGMYSFGAKFAVMVAATSTAVLYNRHRIPPGDDGTALLREELLLLSNTSSPETISTAVLDLTGIPHEGADAIQHWLTQRKESAIDATGHHHSQQQELQAMHALGRLPGFRAERSDEVLGLYNLYTFLRDQFMQRMREVRAAADTGTLWLLPDPSETLKAWAQKDGHEVADLLLDRYSFGLSCLLPQDLEVRPGRLYREVALTPTLVIGSAFLRPADLEFRGLNKQLRAYRSAVVPLHLPADAAAAAAVAAAGGGVVDVDAAVAAAAARPFAYMVVAMGSPQDMTWRRLVVEGVPKVTAVHYVRAMEASKLLHTCSEQDGSVLQTKLGNALSWTRVFQEGILKYIGLDPGTLVDVGAGRTIHLTQADMRDCWLSKQKDTEGAMLLGAGLQVVLFLPPGNGVLVPNKTKTKGKPTPYQVPWTIELLIRRQLLQLVLKYPPAPVLNKYGVLLHQQAARAEQIRTEVQQRLQGAGSSSAAAAANLATAQQQAQVVLECQQQLQQERDQVAQDFGRPPITLGWLLELKERSSTALQQAEDALAAASPAPAAAAVAAAAGAATTSHVPAGDVSAAVSISGAASSNSSSSEDVPLSEDGGPDDGMGSGAAAVTGNATLGVCAGRRKNPAPRRTPLASSLTAPKTPATPRAAGAKRAKPTPGSCADAQAAADSTSTKRVRREVKVNLKYDPDDLVMTKEEEAAAVAAGEWGTPPGARRGRGGAATGRGRGARGGGRWAAAGGRGGGAAARTQQLPLQQPAPDQQPAQQQPLVLQAVQQLQGVEGVLSQLAAAAGEPAAADAAELLAAVQPHVQAFTSKWGA